MATIDLVTLAGGLGALLLHRPELDALGAAVVVGQTLCLLGVVALLEISTPRPEPRDVAATPAEDDGPSRSRPEAGRPAGIA